MKRREFVRNMALASAGTPILINNMKFQSIGKKLFDVPKMAEDRVLVIIRLNGGNDGLNTIIPRDQYSNLAIQRNNILIPEASVLQLTPEVGLHPVMTGMQGMWNDGKLGIIQNVGYPEQNRSHFRSMDIWTSGLIDNPATTGWLGRAFDQDLAPLQYPTDFPNATYEDPFAISMGYNVSQTCQGLLANYSQAVVDPLASWNLGTSTSVNDGTYYGDHIEYITTVMDQANAYGAQINNAANSGNTLSTMYDPNNALATQLQYVAQMISGGLQTKVYVLNINGFDTHDSQVSLADTTQGTHADLIKMLSDAVAAFQDDLMLLGIEERVAGMTFSEFGRQVASNASLGTDHGDAAPLMLFGTCLDIGIMGTNPTISNTITNQAGIPMQYDFRDIYASILKDWFGIPVSDIETIFPEHTIVFHNLIGACNVGLEEEDLGKEKALIFPNPAYTNATVRFNCDNEWVKVDIYDMNQRHVMSVFDGQLNQGQHDIFMETRDLSMGQYFTQVKKESGTIITTLVKAR